MKTKRIATRSSVAAAITLVTLGFGLAPAMAAQLYPLTGTLNTSGTLIQYSTYRPHASGGSNFAISNNVGCADNRWSRFGLRVNDSTQYTQTLQFNGETGSQAFKRASDGSATIAAGSYAINGRMANETGHGCDNAWAGSMLL